MLLYLKDAPKLEDENSCEEVLQFIDQFISCKYDPKNPLMSFQRHKHTHTCYKRKNKTKKKCRFHYPKYVFPRTKILNPLNKDESIDLVEMKNISKNIERIDALMNKFFKTNISMSFQDILVDLEMTEDEYILAIRSKIKNPTVFLKRSSLEVAINPYNLFILQLLQSNMDIQFILNSYACISYICDYLTKPNIELSKLLRKATDEIDNGNIAIKDKLQSLAKRFINATIISVQEAVYIIFSLSLSRCSRGVYFINTNEINKRNRMLKSKDKLKDIDGESDNIYEYSIFDYYSKRMKVLENVCLADFVSEYQDWVIKNKPLAQKFKTKEDDENDNDVFDEEIEEIPNENNLKRHKRRILKFFVVLNMIQTKKNIIEKTFYYSSRGVMKKTK